MDTSNYQIIYITQGKKPCKVVDNKEVPCRFLPKSFISGNVYILGILCNFKTLFENEKR